MKFQHGKYVAILIFFSSLAFHLICENEAATSSNFGVGYYLQIYNSINSFRAKHTVPALRWDRSLTSTAEYIATRILTASDAFDIDETDGVNFFVSYGAVRPPPTFPVETWYNESSWYNYNSPGYNAATLNFTQMIWKSSNSVGIGAYSINNFTAVVAKFSPVGNTKGSFRQNVLEQYRKM